MPKREFLMLAHVYKSEPVGGWFWSEKLDGMRAFWDGGLTRGMLVSDVPFANSAKDARYIVQPRATGLWSRYGKPIQAPGWWLDMMPPCQMDGELYIDRGRFQQLMSTCKKLVPSDADWHDIKYMAFDVPPYHVVFGDGEIDNKPNFQKVFKDVVAKLRIGLSHPRLSPGRWDFTSVQNWLRDQGWDNRVFNVHLQGLLPPSSTLASAYVQGRLEDFLRAGAEGLILRHPGSLWAAQRARTMLKVKGMLDDEAEVVSYTWGRETDRGSKLLGLMGALVLRYKGSLFELSGFTEDERVMCFSDGLPRYDFVREIGRDDAGKPVIKGIHNPQFPIGSKVTFKYRELTDDGIPKEARYWRKA